MDAIAAIRAMVSDSGLSQSEVSRRMMRSPNFISDVIYHNKDVRIATLTEIARACGFKIMLASDTGKIIELSNGSQKSSICHLW